MKTDFARDKCLSGVMVWAISHDTKNASYSEALRIAAPRPGGSWTEDELFASDVDPQCKWTNWRV